MDHLLRIHMDGNKLYVFGECSTDEHEMYLPDCTEEKIKKFLSKHVDHVAQVLTEVRPWNERQDTANDQAQLRSEAE